MLYVTREEIFSQPDVWAETLRHLKAKNPGGYPELSDFTEIIFTGCGSTYYLSRWAARLYEAVTGIVCRAVSASDLVFYPSTWVSPHKKKRLLIAVSRSGETTETIHAVKKFRQDGSGETLVITCYPDSELALMTPLTIETPHGQEESIVQTRSFSSMMLAVSWFLYRDIPDDVISNMALTGKKVLNLSANLVDRLSAEGRVRKVFFLGGGPWYGLANECMLKLKEMSLTYTEAYHFMEFRHGPMSMIDDSSLVVGLLSSSSATPNEIKVLAEMKELGAQTMALAEAEIQPGDAIDHLVVFDSGALPAWYAPLFLPAAQLMALSKALQKGLNPDLPNNLKAVVKLDSW